MCERDRLIWLCPPTFLVPVLAIRSSRFVHKYDARREHVQPIMWQKGVAKSIIAYVYIWYIAEYTAVDVVFMVLRLSTPEICECLTQHLSTL